MEGSSLARVDIDAGLAFRSESCTSELKNEILLPNKFWAVPLATIYKQYTFFSYNLQFTFYMIRLLVWNTLHCLPLLLVAGPAILNHHYSLAPNYLGTML